MLTVEQRLDPDSNETHPIEGGESREHRGGGGSRLLFGGEARRDCVRVGHGANAKEGTKYRRGKENGGKGTEAQRREKKREMRLIRPEAYNLPLRRARSVRSGASALTHSV